MNKKLLALLVAIAVAPMGRVVAADDVKGEGKFVGAMKSFGAWYVGGEYEKWTEDELKKSDWAVKKNEKGEVEKNDKGEILYKWSKDDVYFDAEGNRVWKKDGDDKDISWKMKKLFLTGGGTVVAAVILYLAARGYKADDYQKIWDIMRACVGLGEEGVFAAAWENDKDLVIATYAGLVSLALMGAGGLMYAFGGEKKKETKEKAGTADTPQTDTPQTDTPQTDTPEGS